MFSWNFGQYPMKSYWFIDKSLWVIKLHFSAKDLFDVYADVVHVVRETMGEGSSIMKDKVSTAPSLCRYYTLSLPRVVTGRMLQELLQKYLQKRWKII